MSTRWLKNDPGQAFRKGKSRAKQRRLKWELTLAQFKKLYSKRCVYCKRSFPRNWGHGIDQKNAGKGYTIDNVVACCGPCNKLKSNTFSYAEMLEIGKVAAPTLRSLYKRKGI